MIILIGQLANILGIVCIFPQIYKTLKTKTNEGFSFVFLLLRFISSVLWLIYGIGVNDYVLTIGAIFTGDLGLIQIGLFIFFTRNTKRLE
jgi:uncharacterized protein with PQ loop repeat